MNFLKCPESIWNSSKECKEIRKFIINDDKCGQKYGEVYFVTDLMKNWNKN
jgi:hypothetical protein